MSDPALIRDSIIEAAKRALEDRWNNNRATGAFPFPLSTGEALQAVLAAVTPLIEAAVLEEAAMIVDDYSGRDTVTRKELAARIRALKEQP